MTTRAVPFEWLVLEHQSATVAFEQYQPLLRRARWLLRKHPDMMLLADRGFVNHQLSTHKLVTAEPLVLLSAHPL
ncbi:hypothetical protein [Acaryochloris marina]|uniref:hypothetical protein n=1 Tax=Acaryochloris marina TaxID=155978 RepID=UPI0021C2D473|nr:hypothetical protein [Acaryochloris marina]BDM83386.1 hypothetical protein AM10699_62470 [Acaryochloris marina MBIC10699]